MTRYTMVLDGDITKILLTATNSTDAIKRLFELKRSRNKNFSMSLLGKRVNLSKSYVSEVIAGKKTLNMKYLTGFAKAIPLGPLEADCLSALLSVDRTKDEAAHLKYQDLLRRSRRVLRLIAMNVSTPMDDIILAFDVFASFSIFGNEMSLDQLQTFFPDRTPAELELCLQFLLQRGAIQRRGERYQQSELGLVLNTGQSASEFVPFWKQAAQDAMEHMAEWAPQNKDSCFSSYVVSVHREDYRILLEEFKSSLLAFASRCDSAKADTLVRMNVQIYPVRSLTSSNLP